MRRTVNTDKAPAPIGPYSHANVVGDFVFTSGQVGVNPVTGEFGEGVEEQTRLTFENLKLVLEAAGSGLDKIVKTTCFLQNMDDFKKMNAVYASFFEGNFPSRSAFEVAKLPGGALVEIEAVAYIEK